jgi:hypothetical protein
MTYLIIGLAIFGVWTLFRVYQGSRDQLWRWQYHDTQILLPLRRAWLQQPPSDNVRMEFRNRRTGATMHIIPGPQMDAQTAMSMSNLMQMLVGIRIDPDAPIGDFRGHTGRGLIRRSNFGDNATSWLVVEAGPLIINACTISRSGPTDPSADAVRALSRVIVIRWPPRRTA